MDDPSSINLITTSGPKKSTFCIGLFDFYKLVVIILTTISEKKTPKKFHYRDYKNFTADEFQTEFMQRLDNNSCNYKIFELLDKHA